MKGALLDGFIRSDGKDGVGHRRCSRKGSGESTALTRLGPTLNATDPVGQSEQLVDYGERHRAGLRVGTALTEGTANFLVNGRMNKSQQMRWSRRGADR